MRAGMIVVLPATKFAAERHMCACGTPLGQTFDGITLGDMSHGNFNGLGIGRAIDSDNLGGATVLQGSGALGTSSSNNLCGAVQYASADPFAKRTVSLSQLAGEANTFRTSGRFDTGLLTFGTSSGIKAFLSYSRIDNDKWKGSGTRASPAANVFIGSRGGLFGTGQTWQDQINAKAQFFTGPHPVVAYYGLSDRTGNDYTDLSLTRWRSSGRDWDQFSPGQPLLLPPPAPHPMRRTATPHRAPVAIISDT